MRHWMCAAALLFAALLATTLAAPASILPASLIDEEAAGVETSSHGSDDDAWDNSLGYFRLSRPEYSVRDLGLAPRYYVDTSRFRQRPVTVVRFVSRPDVDQQDTRIPFYRVFAGEVEEVQMSPPAPVADPPGVDAGSVDGASQPPEVSDTSEAASGTAHTSEDSKVLGAEKALDAAVYPNTPEVSPEVEENANVSKASESEGPPATPEPLLEADDRSEDVKASVAIDSEPSTTTGAAMESKTQAMEGETEPAVEVTNQHKDLPPTREESEAEHVKETEDDGKVEFDEVANVSELVEEQVADDGGKSMTPEGLLVEGTMEEKEGEGSPAMEEKEVEGTMEDEGRLTMEEKEVEGRPAMEEKEVEGTLEAKKVDGLKITGEGTGDVLASVYEAEVEGRTESSLQVTQDGDVQSISVHEQEVEARRESAAPHVSDREEGTKDTSNERELWPPPEAGGNVESITTTATTTTTTTTTELEEEEKESSSVHVAEESRQVTTSEIPNAYMCIPISISSIRSETKAAKHPKPLVHPPVWKPIRRERYRLLQSLVHKPISEPFDRFDRYTQSIGYDAHNIF